MNDLTKTIDDLAQAQTTVNQTEAERDALLETLRQKEAELNTTQTELANLNHRTGNEITALRSELANMTSQVDTCRAALGLPTVDPILSSPKAERLPLDHDATPFTFRVDFFISAIKQELVKISQYFRAWQTN
ncbi:aggrecan core protein [Elysia marginata]|uniref:Aggrecan core protein n=1 Tax=Elysia marginata TaxID=1093978 RepID=A0AAV4EX94_9GAST|nr:aggrecan core protein [Elysia marginata]